MNTPPIMAGTLPQRPDTERALLGAVLVDNSALRNVESILSGSDFFVSAHRRIFSAMQSLAVSGKPVETHTLWDALAHDSEVIGAGGVAYIASLSDLVHQRAPVTHWAKIIRDAAILRNAAYAGESLTRAALEPHANANEIVKHAHALSISLSASTSDSVFGVLASDVLAEDVKWLWPSRIPLGKITVLDGDPGLGKSATALDIGARITKGRPMPDGSIGIEGGVLVLNAEDGSADTIVPRLLAMGADLKRVRILKTLRSSEGDRQPEIPGDLAAIEHAAESIKARLIIVDPLMAFLASETNSFRDQDVRRALAPLAITAERTSAAVLVVRHLNKNAEGNPLYRGGGSIGIIGAARSGLLVARDPDDASGQSRILAVTKANLGPSCSSLRYSIEPHTCGSIYVRWSGESTHEAAALLALPGGEDGRTSLDEAGEFLRSVLEDGPLSAKDVLRKGQAAGFADRTLRRAKTIVGIKAERQGFGPGSTWVWKLPPKMTNPRDLATFEQTTDSTSIESTSSPKMAKKGDMAIFERGVATFAAGESNHRRIRVVSCNLKEPPVAVDDGVVTDANDFSKTTLEQLRRVLENPKARVGWSVPQLVDRLWQVGVVVEVSE